MNAKVVVLSFMFTRIESIKLNIQQYVFGSITLAIVAGLIAFGITYSALVFSGKIAARKSGKTQ